MAEHDDVAQRGIVVTDDVADTCLMAFGGIANGIGMPPFEFFRVAEGLPTVRILIRDLNQEWYQRGIRDVGDGISSTAVALRALLDERGVKRVVCFGNSAGGFAAMLFGSLIGAEVVYAFSPQTNMTRAFRARHLDRRWRREVRAMRRNLPPDNVLDMRPVVRAAAVPVELYYSADSRLDERHAEHLADLSNIRSHRYAEGGHDLIRVLRDSGKLRELLVSSLG